MTATATFNDDQIGAVVAELERQLATLGEAGDCASYNEQAEYERRQSMLMGSLRTIRESARILAEVEPAIAADEQWLDTLHNWDARLTADLEACHARDPRIPNLQISRRVIVAGPRILRDRGSVLEDLALGDLMRQDGYAPTEPPTVGEVGLRLPWRGGLVEIEQRLRDRKGRREDARGRLAQVLAEVDAKRDMRVAGV